MKRKLLTLTILLSLLAPATSLLAAGLVPDCGKVVPTVNSSKKVSATASSVPNPCDFEDAMQLINNIIKFLLFYFATPLAGLALAYAGGSIILSGGSSEKITKAKKIIKNVIIGYIIALAAWLIVKTIFTTLGFQGETFLK